VINIALVEYGLARMRQDSHIPVFVTYIVLNLWTTRCYQETSTWIVPPAQELAIAPSYVHLIHIHHNDADGSHGWKDSMISCAVEAAGGYFALHPMQPIIVIVCRYLLRGIYVCVNACLHLLVVLLLRVYVHLRVCPACQCFGNDCEVTSPHAFHA
jgi:hypothetical protein